MSNVKIRIKRSLVPGEVPELLSLGELAVNIPDKKIFVGNGSQNILLTDFSVLGDNLTEAIQDLLNTTLVEGENVNITYADTDGLITIAVPTSTLESVISNYLEAGTNITITENTDGKLVISSTGGGATWTNTNPTIATDIFGVPANTVIPIGENPIQVLERILYPFQPGTVTTFTMSGVTTEYEIGQTSGVPTFTYSFTNRANIATLLLNYQRVSDSALPQGTLTAPKTQDTNQTFTPKDYYGGLRDATATLDVATETIVLTSGTTNNLYVGLNVEKLSGTGAFDAGTVVTNIIDSSTFVVNKKPTTSGSTTFEVGANQFESDIIGAGMNFFLSGTQTNSQYTFSNSTTRSIRWWSRMYWGYSTLSTLTNRSQISTGEQNRFIRDTNVNYRFGTTGWSDSAITWNTPSDQQYYLYLLIHNNYWSTTPAFWDNGTGLQFGFSSQGTISLTNNSGLTQTYRVYRSAETFNSSKSLFVKDA